MLYCNALYIAFNNTNFSQNILIFSSNVVGYQANLFASNCVNNMKSRIFTETIGIVSHQGTNKSNRYCLIFLNEQWTLKLLYQIKD